jgi:uncharacterized protein YrrD
MQFRNGVDVYTSDKHEVGKVDRVVIDPVTKQTTHLIVRKGVFFAEDKVVPVTLVDEAKEDYITLHADEDDFESLPDFEENHFIMLDSEEAPAYSLEDAQPMYWYPFGVGAGIPPAVAPQPYLVETRRNIPEQAVALKEGAKVTSVDGKHIGDIERVFVDPDTNRIWTFLVSKGFFLREHLFIPVEWVAEFGENSIRLTVGSSLIERQSRLIETMHAPDEVR